MIPLLVTGGSGTMLLAKSDLERLVDIDDALHLLTEGFRGQATTPALRARADLPANGTATCLMPGLLPGIPAYTVKINAKFPDATPALRGVVCLHDLNTGELLALADSATVTVWRTGLAAALAIDLLASPSADTLGFVGAGAQAAMVAKGLRHLRHWSLIVATDFNSARAARLGTALPNVDAVMDAADVVVFATWSRKPLIEPRHLRPAHCLTTLGADEPGKVEIGANVLTRSRVIVDDLELVTATGALGNTCLDAQAAAGTIGQIVRGDLPAHDISGRPTVYAPIGLPWQDLALTWTAYNIARGRHGIRSIDLLA